MIIYFVIILKIDLKGITFTNEYTGQYKTAPLGLVGQHYSLGASLHYLEAIGNGL